MDDTLKFIINKKLKSFVNSKLVPLKYFRLKPFNTSTESGRAEERHRRIVIATISGFLAQAVNYSVMLVMVPMLLKYLGKEQYGLWLSISACASFMVFADLGMGNGLINLLGKTHGLDDRMSARKYVSSVFVVLGITALVLLCVGVPAILKIDWSIFFQLTTLSAKRVATLAILIFFLFFLLNLIVGVATKVRMAYQEMHINNGFQVVGKVLSLIGVFVGIAFKMPFLFFVVVLAGTQTLSLVINSWETFFKSKRWLKPTRQAIDLDIAKELFSTGSFFFISGISGTIATQIDTLIIARFLGAESVPSFAVPLKLFMLSVTLMSFIVMPLWPAFREAIVRKDLKWAKKTFLRALFLSFFFTTVASIGLYFLLPFILKIWTAGVVKASASMRLTLGIYAMTCAVMGPMAIFLNGANILKWRAVIGVINAVSNLCLSIYLVQRIGIMGPLWGTIICQLTFSIWVSLFYIIRFFRRTNGMLE